MAAVTYTSAIKACGDRWQWEQALSVFRARCERRSRPITHRRKNKTLAVKAKRAGTVLKVSRNMTHVLVLQHLDELGVHPGGANGVQQHRHRRLLLVANTAGESLYYLRRCVSDRRVDSQLQQPVTTIEESPRPRGRTKIRKKKARSISL